jgi:hypothetical protein
MASNTEEIRRQLEESARGKLNFSGELIGRIAQFAEKSAVALRSAAKVDFLLDVSSRDPQCIHDAHITSGHIVCSLIEQLAPSGR